MKTVLVTNFFTTDNKQRISEFNSCLEINLGNPHIHQIVVMYTDLIGQVDFSSYPLLNNEKVKVVPLKQGRLSFKDVFEYANISHRDDVVVLANTDIYFDSSLVYAQDLAEFFCGLTRYDNRGGKWALTGDGKMGSYDTWIFKGSTKNFDDIGIFLGIIGCDGFIMLKARREGIKICNPSLTIKTYHVDGGTDDNRYDTAANFRKNSVLANGATYHDHPVFRHIGHRAMPVTLEDIKP